MPTYHSASSSSAEDLFIELFSDTFGAEKASYLYSQYPFSDIYQNSRFADFLIENGGRKVAIEIDDEASHNPKLVSQNKFYDDLLKQKQHDLSGLGRVPLGGAADAAAAGDRQGRVASIPGPTPQFQGDRGLPPHPAGQVSGRLQA